MKVASGNGKLTGLSAVAKQGRVLNDIRKNLDEEINRSFDRITDPQSGIQGQLSRLQIKWGKLSENQQYLSNLMIQLKDVQSVWKMQLNINRKMSKLSQFGFATKPSNDSPQRKKRKLPISVFGICGQIIDDIHSMMRQSDRCIVQLNLVQRNSRSSRRSQSPRSSKTRESKSSMNDIVQQLEHENDLYSNMIIEIVKFIFNSTITVDTLSITLQSTKEFQKVIQCLDSSDITSCISFIHSILRNSLFDPLFDASSPLFKMEIDSDPKSLTINKVPVTSNQKMNESEESNDNPLCHNVDALIRIIQWLEKTIFASIDSVCTHWKETHLFPSMDQWVICWINSNTPVLSSLLSVPRFQSQSQSQFNRNNDSKTNDDDDDDDALWDDLQHSAIDHIHQSIGYRQNIECALNALSGIMSAQYLIESLQLLAVDEDDEYGLSSKILSDVLPSKIQQFIYGSIRSKIKGHDYEAFDPLHLLSFRKMLTQRDKSDGDSNEEEEEDDSYDGMTKMISYHHLIDRSESFFGAQPCKISLLMFEIVVILYHFGMFVEQMYYVVDDSDEDIIRISTMYVDLFMSVMTNVIQLWMSLTVSYHERYFNEVSSLGFQFYNDCCFLAHHLVHLSIATNHGEALITDTVRNKMESQGMTKYIWLMQYVEPLKAAGKRYFLHHLHNQRETILRSLKITNEFRSVEDERVKQEIQQSFSESLVSISQFLNGCRSTIPDKLLYQIGGRLLECICGRVVDQVMQRIEDSEHSDIGINAAHNISLVIRHISKFALLEGDLPYLVMGIDRTWRQFKQLGAILDQDYNLKLLTNALNKGHLDVFDKYPLIKLVCAIWSESTKREAIIAKIEERFS